MINLKNKRVLLTGSSSMIGGNIIAALDGRDATVLTLPHDCCDLTDGTKTSNFIEMLSPDYFIHAAGYNGGIAWNKKYPADIFDRTVRMGINVLKGAQEAGVKRGISIISSCAYPDGNFPITEGTLHMGPPNESVECHGYAKRILDIYSRQLNKQFGTEFTTCVLTNCYGPGDNTHPEKTKAVMGLIKKIVDAKRNGLPFIECWGTGSPVREFMYASDAGEAIVQALERYSDTTKSLNLGSGEEITIRDLVDTIVELVGYKGEVRWDHTKPDGQYIKVLQTITMQKLLDVDITDLKAGLSETIKWYEKLSV